MLATLACSLILAAPVLVTDEIELVNGKVLTVDRVTGESFKEVTYKTLGGGTGRKPADQVRTVQHETSAQALDDYQLALDQMANGDFAAAVGTFETVLQNDRLMNRNSYSWVKQHTLSRMARCYYSMADYDEVAATVDRLLTEVPDTFFYAPMLLLKADALAKKGDEAAAEEVYRDLAADVNVKELPERWAREAELGLVLQDENLKGQARQQRLATLVEKNRNDYPTVASRANVEIGNSMVRDGDYSGARSFFQRIVDEGKADDRTIAAAFAGLGDCFYHQGLEADDADTSRSYYEDAVLAHLRVATMYKEQVELVPRSIFYAASAFKRMGNPAESRDVARRLCELYGNSPWVAKMEEELGIRCR